MQLDNYKSLDFNALTDDEVVFFIRINGKKSYFNAYYPDSLLKRFKKLKEFRTISEYRKDANIYIDLKKFQYTNISEVDKELIFNTLNLNEVIKRCRVLRMISYYEAKSLIFSSASFFIDLYRNSKIKLIVSGAVDNYVMDVMIQFATVFDIKVLGITDFFLYPKYKLVTVYGEHNHFSEPEDSEIEAIYQKLINKAKSPLAISKFKAVTKAIKEFASYYFRYFFRYILKYKIGGFLEYEYRFAPYFKGFISLKQLFVAKYFDSIDFNEVRKDRNKFVYIPLHFYPEATIDYWTDHPEKSDYLHGVLDVINHLKEKGKIAVLKEHPAYYLSRQVSFYEEIKKNNNVILLSPFVLTQDIIDEIDQLIIWNGSTGVEALLLNKRISIVTESYYSRGKLKNYKDLDLTTVISDEEKKDLIRHILRTSIKVD